MRNVPTTLDADPPARPARPSTLATRRPATDFRYSLLFAAPETRVALGICHRLWSAIGNSVECSDPTVAQAKLAWWRNEISEMRAGRAQHPDAMAFARLHPRYALPGEPLTAYLDVLVRATGPLALSRYDDLAPYAHAAGGGFARLVATLLDASEAEQLGAARLGAALWLARRVESLGADLRRGRVYVPEEDMRRFGVTPSDLRTARMGAGIRSLLAFQVERAQRELERVVDALSPVARKRLLPLLIDAGIRQATLREIARDGYRVLDRRLMLPPARLLWLAWKTRRQVQQAAHS